MGNRGLSRARCICGRSLWFAAALLGAMLAGKVDGALATPQTAVAPKAAPVVGTIKTISGGSLSLITDAGAEWKVQLPPDVKVLRVPPGSRDLKDATAIPLGSLQPGDRILVRGTPGNEAGTFVAVTVVAMKKEDIAEKQAKEREEWQQHGIGGLVKSVDAASSTITISRLSATGVRDVLIHAPTGTIVRRYAPGSVKFDEAKVASLTEIRAGDQLRARGARSADGSEFTADEVVSGSFRNVAGPILAVNAATGTLTVTDLATKKPVELKVTTDSQMRKLPQPVAQRIALRLKGTSGEANGTGATAGQAGQATGAPTAAPPGVNGNANGGAPGAARGGASDIQQMLSRLPVSPLSEFQKGDAVMIVATPNTGDAQATVITLLGGVEPILQGTSQGQAASLLSPWSLSEGGGGDAGTP
jgi:hypothetical protein